jgi:hypothetical protein
VISGSAYLDIRGRRIQVSLRQSGANEVLSIRVRGRTSDVVRPQVRGPVQPQFIVSGLRSNPKDYLESPPDMWFPSYETPNLRDAT